jgi:hypothetical protein
LPRGCPKNADQKNRHSFLMFTGKKKISTVMPLIFLREAQEATNHTSAIPGQLFKPSPKPLSKS